MHISCRMGNIALQSAIGGIALRIVSMLFVATGNLDPVKSTVIQEFIDIAPTLDALKAAFPRK